MSLEQCRDRGRGGQPSAQWEILVESRDSRQHTRAASANASSLGLCAGWYAVTAIREHAGPRGTKPRQSPVRCTPLFVIYSLSFLLTDFWVLLFIETSLLSDAVFASARHLCPSAVRAHTLPRGLPPRPLGHHRAELSSLLPQQLPASGPSHTQRVHRSILISRLTVPHFLEESRRNRESDLRAFPAMQVLLLDEPTAGSDPLWRHRVWNLLRERKSDHVVLFSTPFMDEADVLAGEPRVSFVYLPDDLGTRADRAQQGSSAAAEHEAPSRQAWGRSSGPSECLHPRGHCPSRDSDPIAKHLTCCKIQSILPTMCSDLPCLRGTPQLARW